ncbi:MAG TPA: GntR family transcriptional regulator [Acidobacteriaceae bacterium]|nr:GntR family transcriptional regulator [Acidobacteriaceae bacterium]
MPLAASKERKSSLGSKAEHGTSVLIAFEKIRELIVRGQLSPGTWIVEGDLAERLNMSRTPVRSALHLLQREGYVLERKISNKSRMMVAPLTKEDASELYSIVGRVEGFAGRQLGRLPKARRATVAQTLRGLNSQLAKIAKNRNLAGNIFDVDRKFHQTIVNMGAGPRLLRLHQAIEPQTERYWRLYASSIIDNLHVSIAEHEEIIDAILAGDEDMIERALQKNWENGYSRLEKVIDMFGERGSW